MKPAFPVTRVDLDTPPSCFKGLTLSIASRCLPKASSSGFRPAALPAQPETLKPELHFILQTLWHLVYLGGL